MRTILGTAMLPVAALMGCATEAPSGPPEYIGSQVQQVSDTVFAVGIEAKNADEYAFVRCVAANHAKYQEVAAFGELEGEALHTRFLKVDGKRLTHSYGVRRFTIETKGKSAPKKIYPVRETLAACAQKGIPTGATGGAQGNS